MFLTSILGDQVSLNKANTSDGYFYSQRKLKIVMHFNAKRLCQVSNRPHLCILYLSIFFLVYLPIKYHGLPLPKAANQGLFYPLTVPINNNFLFEKRNSLFSTEISKNTRNSGRVQISKMQYIWSNDG